MRQTVTTACMIMLGLSMAGCFGGDGGPPAQVAHQPRADYLGAATVKAVNEGEGDTAVESALIWSEKYSQTMEKLVFVQQENRKLTEKSRQQTHQISGLHGELKQCQKELGEANGMLLEMQAALDKWQTNVLGFRKEMRKAQETELVALRRILKLLGSEMPAEEAEAPTVTAVEGSSR